MDTHPYGWLSLLPSLLAIVLAIATRRVVLSMFIGLVTGSLITTHGDVVRAVGQTIELHLWNSLIDKNRLQVFAFTIVMGAMVGVIQRAGGMSGLVQLVARWAYNRRRGQLAAWVLGMLIFFDDYANTVLLGSTLQPLCRRLRISREKLAYLVDSTAAPVAGLAVISTWVAGEIGFVQDGLDSLEAPGESVTAFELFIRSIPYRFYVIWSLVFVLLIGLLQRDFGPMLAAERRCVAGDDEGSRVRNSEDDVAASGWWNAVIPVGITVGAVLWFLYQTGVQSLLANPDEPSHSLWQIIGNADSYFALLWGSIAGLSSAVVLAWVQKLLNGMGILRAIAHGARLMLPALLILWLAASLSTMTGHDVLPGAPVADATESFSAQGYRLYTGEYLVGLLASDASASDASQLAPWMPTIIFVLSAFISFATGTSWGTMAIVMPIAIPLAYGTIAHQTGLTWHEQPVLIGTIASVLAGSIFGDHCSPISDTTVLSSQACGCEHTAHVWTQLPYALAVGVVSIVLGTLPIGFGISAWIMLPIGIIAMAGMLWAFGRRVE